MKNIFKSIGIALTAILLTAGSVSAATILFPTGGGTGTSTPPTYGQVLVGNSGGTYTLTATSSLGITGGSGGSGTVNSGTTGQFPYYAANGTTLTATSSLFLTTSGNIGIGTTSPTAPLTVSGGSVADPGRAITISGQQYPRMYFNGDGSGFITGNAGIQFNNANNYFFGIGSNLDTPAIKIQANNVVSIDGLAIGYLGLIQDGNLDAFGRTEGNKGAIEFGTDGQDMFRFYETGTAHNHSFTDTVKIQSYYDIPTLVVQASSTQTADIQQWQNSSGTVLAEVTAAGDVGIGTDSPAYKLDVNGTLSVSEPATFGVTDKAYIFPDYAGNGELPSGALMGNYSTGGFSFFPSINAVTAGAKVVLGYWDGTGGRSAVEVANTSSGNGTLLLMKSGGNVGIGTTTPGSLLSVGDTNGINFRTATSTFSTTGGINLASGCYAVNGTCITAGGGGGGSITGSTGQVAYFSGTNTAVGTSSLFIATSKNVGIGTTTPKELLNIGCSSGYCTSRIDSGVVSGYMSVNDVFPSVNIGSNSNHPLNFIVNNTPVGNWDTSGNLNIGNANKVNFSTNTFGGYLYIQSDGTGDNGLNTIAIIKAPRLGPQEADLALFREDPYNTANAEFTDINNECYSASTTAISGTVSSPCYDHLDSWVVAKKGAGTLRPFAVRFWDQSLGDIAKNGYITLLTDPSGATAIGSYSTSTYDKTIPLQVSSSTASTLFKLSSGSTSKLTVNSGGTITTAGGINAYTSGTIGSGAFYYIQDTGAGGVQTGCFDGSVFCKTLLDGGPLILNTRASNNVGVATTSPWRTFSVNGSSDLGLNALAGYFTATTTTASVFPYASTTAITASGQASTTNMYVSSLGTAAGTFIAADPQGRLIATTTPTSSSGAYPFAVTGNATSTLTQFNGGLTAYASSTIGNGTFGLTTNGTATTTGRAYFGGNVGIGTSTPQSRLVIQDDYPVFKVFNTSASQFAGAGFYLTNSAATMGNQAGVTHYMGINDAGATQGFYAIDKTNVSGGGTGHLALFDYNADSTTLYTNNTARFTILTSGNTGISSTTPFKKFSVTGTVAIDGLTSATGKNSVCIDSATKEIVNAGNTTCATSSKKTKHDITSLSNSDALRTILNLNPVSFTYNDGDDNRVGFIAEEVNEIDPRLVELAQEDTLFNKASGVIKKGEPISVEYGNITALLVKVVQNQQKQLSSIVSGKIRSVEENWQWFVIGLLALGFIYQQIQIKKLKK